MDAHPADTARRKVTAVGYRPPAGHALDIEIVPLAALRQRVGDPARRGHERIDFHCLLFVTAGQYVHIADFAALTCRAGTLVLLQPGQVHHFGDLSRAEGWMLIIRAEALDPAAGALLAPAEDLPPHLALSSAALQAVKEVFARLARDSTGPASPLLNALLRAEVAALLIRLRLHAGAAEDDADAVSLLRFRRFRALLERRFAEWHDVAPYAQALGCSAKSLDRAARAISDRSAKAVIVERVVLEAKRLLAHAPLPVASVGYELGFSEPTNFGKFFQRETRMTPGAFRARMRRGVAA